MGNRNLAKFVVFYFFTIILMLGEMRYRLTCIGMTLSLLVILSLSGRLEKRLIMIIISAIGLGVVVSIWAIYYYNFSTDELENGRVVGYLYKELDGDRHYTLRASQILDAESRLMSGKYKVYTKAQDIDGYKRVEMSINAMEVQSKRNPMDVSLDLINRSKGYRGVLYAKEINVIDNDIRSIAFNIFSSLRKRIIQGLRRAFSEEVSGLIIGLTFGDTTNIDDDIKESFRLSGTAHILAVSGLHMGILYLSITNILGLFHISKKYKIVLTIIPIWCFVLFTGKSPSIIRACLMITLSMIPAQINRRYDTITALALVVLLSTLYNPYVIYNISFQLSLGAVLAIVLFYPSLFKLVDYVPIPKVVKSIIAMSLAAQIGTIPIQAYSFNRISLIGVFFNIPVILIIGILLPMLFVTLVLAVISTKLTMLWGVFTLPLLRLILFINSFADRIWFGQVITTSPYFYDVILYIFVLIMLFKPLGYRKYVTTRITIYICTLLLIPIALNRYQDNRFLKYVFFDVGQGDCVLIQTPYKGSTILIDGGREDDDKLLKILLRNRISSLDLVILTHNDEDHINGLLEVVDNLDIGSLMIGDITIDSDNIKRLLDSCERRGIEVIKAYRGLDFILNKEIELSVLNPMEENIGHLDKNNNSIVNLIRYKNCVSLHTGDVEGMIEYELAGMDMVDVDILKLGHHGSNTSSTNEFLRSVNPDVAIIQVGKNRYGHPSDSVIKRLEQNNIKYYRNDSDGAIIIEYKKNELIINKMIE